MYDTIASVDTEFGGNVGIYFDKDHEQYQLRLAAPFGAMYDILSKDDMDKLITQLMERY